MTKNTLQLMKKTFPQAIPLIVASACLLYSELMLIRWASSELRFLSYFKNLVLISAFLGAGVGIAIGPRRPKLSYAALPLLLLYAVAIPILGKSELFQQMRFSADVDFFHGLLPASTIMDSVVFLGIYAVLFVASFIFFVCVGVLVGRELSYHPALYGYFFNLLGSLIGVGAFAAISLTPLGPAVWLCLLAFPLAYSFQVGRRVTIAAIVILLTASLVVHLVSDKAIWSAYSKITIQEWVGKVPGVAPVRGYFIKVNRSYHMSILNLQPPLPPNNPWFNHAALHYNTPYLFVNPDEVLVLGSGSGNDVAAALRAGARHVDAVELDREIVKIGIRLHPEKPYNSPLVAVHVDDARSFLRKTNKKYDIVVLGLLDSHSLLGSLPGVRLDNYMYTIESLLSIKNHLTADGVMALSFAAANTPKWLSTKFCKLVESTFGEVPIIYSAQYNNSITYLAGPGIHLQKSISTIKQLEGLRKNATVECKTYDKIDVPTDDWPQLYLTSRMIPPVQLTLVGILVLISIASIRAFSPLAGKLDLHFGMLGAGFLLVETKGISDLGILFGGTWWTITGAITGVLIMAILSVLFVMKTIPTNRTPYYAGLFISLVLAYLVRPDLLLTMPLWAAQVIGVFLVAFPVFFSGIVFTISIQEATDVPNALGSNLLGSVFGGFLEYANLSWGIRSLSLLAILLYILSAMAVKAGSKKVSPLSAP